MSAPSKKSCLRASLALSMALPALAAHAQPFGGPPQVGVTVLNTPANPVPVTVTNSPSASAGTPITHAVAAETAASSASQDIVITPPVGAGKRLVVNYINIALTFPSMAASDFATCLTRLNQVSRSMTGPLFAMRGAPLQNNAVGNTDGGTVTADRVVNIVLVEGESITLRCAPNPTPQFPGARTQIEAIVGGTLH